MAAGGQAGGCDGGSAVVQSARCPRSVDPSSNVTLPVAPEGLTVAVRVTVWPSAAGFGEAVKLVVVDVLPTTRVTAPVLPLKLLSPL